MFAAVQPPVKLSLLSLTSKEGTSSWVLVNFFPWKGKEGRGQGSHFFGRGKGTKACSSLWGEGRGQEHATHFLGGCPPLSLLAAFIPLLKAKKGVFACWTKAVLIPFLGYP